MKLTRLALTMRAHSLSLAGLAAISCPLATAADPGWYGGASVGQSRAEVDDMRTFGKLLGGGYSAVSLKHDHRDSGYKLFGGYQFNRYFALEGGYFDLGKFSFMADTLPAGTLRGEYKFRGVNLDAVGTLPITGKLSALARVGVNYAETRDTFSGTGALAGINLNPSQRDTNYKYGLGLKYDLTQHLALQLEAERYRVNDAVGSRNNVDLFSLGLVFRFGGSSSARNTKTGLHEPALVPTPVPVVAAAPQLVIVPMPPRTEQYCSILDIQFEIDNDAIQREDSEKLAVLGTFMTKYPNTTAVIEGHTDDVGTAEYNLKLSQRRADSVVRYLEEQQRITTARLSAVGYGNTRPIADNQSEIGKRQNRRIDAVIACATDIEGLAVAPARVTMALAIEFDQNKAAIRPQYARDLRKVADFMKANPPVTATVEGHTGDLQASPEEAMQISRQRAQNVVNALVDDYGITRNRLAVEGFGDSRRFAYNTSQEGEQENRRINIIFDYPSR